MSRHGAPVSAPVPAHVVLFWNQDYPGYDSPQRPELWLDLFYLVQPKEIILIISTSFDKVHSSRDFISHKKKLKYKKYLIYSCEMSLTTGSFHLLHLMFDDYVLYLVENLYSQERSRDFLRRIKGEITGLIHYCIIALLYDQ